MAQVRFMVMYDDESLDVSLTDGSRLQVSPCGSEYLLEQAPPPHPLQERRRARHRTRFTISRHRDLLRDVLKFRNKYAAQPYLPEELIPKHLRQNLTSEVCEVAWPSADSSTLTRDSSGGVAVSSVDGHAQLTLSGCGQEFTAEFTCRSSRDQNRNQNQNHQCSSSTGVSDTDDTPTPAEFPAHTRVLQHHSRLHPPPAWTHPLYLALSQWEAQRAQCSDAVGQSGAAGKERELGHAHIPPSETVVKTRLPFPVPLTCPAPHQHRWRYGSGASDWSDLSASAELVRVVWCQGIIYRLIGGAVPVVEVSAADGSVIRSNGVLAEYFTHYRPSASTTVESVYYLSALPPDQPGQPYSIRTVLTRASRLLQCYKQASSTRTPIMPQCCWRTVEVKQCEVSVMSDVQVEGTGQFQALSDGTAHINFLDGVQVQMLWNTHTPAQDSVPLSVRAELCQLTLPDGQQHLLQVDGGGAYHRYLDVAGRWCNWVKQSYLSPNRVQHLYLNLRNLTLISQ
uniref:Zgc:153352 n=1 Tax=Astyanax mexicanus TaxID=7994 RepID=W5L0K8_ASTMX